MAAVFACDMCEKSYVRKGNLDKHMAKHSEEEEGAKGDAPLFADIDLPDIDDFPDFDEDYMALVDIDVPFDDQPFCGRCKDDDSDLRTVELENEKLLRKVISLEKALKTLRKLVKDQKNETENARSLLEQATKRKMEETQKVATKEALEEVIEVEEDSRPAEPAKKEIVCEVVPDCILHQCKTCDFNTQNKFAMASHLWLGAHTNRPSPTPKEQKKTKQTVLLRTIPCDQCDVKVLDEAELEHHKQSEHMGPKPCRYGDSCRFLASGSCKFAHREVVQEGWEEVRRRGRRTPTTSRRGVQPCRYDNLCTRGRNCRFTHSKWVWGKATMPTHSTGSKFQFQYNMEEDFPVLNSINRKY